jgi:6-phosphogluconolactonase
METDIGQNTANQLDWNDSWTTLLLQLRLREQAGAQGMRALIRTFLFLALAAIMGCGGSSTSPKAIAFIYAVGQGSNSIFHFKQLSDGELQSSAVFLTATAPRPVAMTLTPSKNFLYVANLTSNAVSGFSVDHTTGVLAPVGNAIPPSPTGPQPIAVGVNSGSQFLFVLTKGDPAATPIAIGPAISIFSIDSRGLLTAAGSAATGAGPVALVVSPTAAVLYVASGSPTATTITPFTIAANGALTPAAGGFTGPAGTNFAGLTVDSKGQFLYAADSGNNAVFSFSIAAGGGLTPVAGSPFAAGTQTVSVAIDATSAFLYAANKGSNDISAFKVNAGVLTPVTGSPFPATASGVTAAAQPAYLTIDPTNQFVYVGNPGSANISGFAINIVDGSLVAVNNSPFGGIGANSIIITQ